MPANVAFPTSSTPGFKPGEGAGRLINCYADKEGQQVVLLRSPGISPWGDATIETPRGMLATDAGLYVAVLDKLVSVNSGGVATVLANSMSGSAPVTMARNNKAPTPDIVIVGDSNAYTVSGANVIAYPDVDVGSPSSVASLGGYFLFTYGNGDIIASDLNSTAINTLSTARAESIPDGLLRVTVSGGRAFFWGASSFEVWYDAGTSPFPLARSEVVNVGLFAPWAIAGAQDGWDLQQIFVASDGSVRRLNGYSPDRISTRAVERDIQAVAVPSTVRACVYTEGGNAFWVLSSPSWTWEYNATTDEWNERKSYGLSRWRADMSARAFGRWIVGDTLSTNLGHVTSTAYDEFGAPLIARAEGVLKEFPARMRIPAVHFDFTVGQGVESGGDPVETDPQVALSWSHDGGADYSNPLWRKLGRQGQHKRQVVIHNIGRSTPHGSRIAWEVSDPVWFQFRGATVINPVPRRP
jgi:hypothetical protein